MANASGGNAWKIWRQEAVTNGIPRCNLDQRCTSKPARYARAMCSAGHGLASWVPYTMPSNESWERNGVMIGDVGFLNLATGAFRHLFNIFHDAKHHAGSPMVIPDNFVPIQPPFQEWDVKVYPDFFPKDTIIASEGVNVTRTSEDSFNFTISTSTQEGAVLVLPKGGSREDLVVTDALYDYIASQALEWFQSRHGYKKSGSIPPTPNGNLHLVTGVDKVPEWSVLSLWRDQTDEGSIEVQYEYRESQPWVTPESDTYEVWNNHLPERQHGGRLSTAFVRGLRIALSPPSWEEYLPTGPADAMYHGPLAASTGSITVPSPSFVRSLPQNPHFSDLVPFHPFFFILQIMLSKVPKKKWPRYIVFDDALWCPFVQGKYLNWAVLVDLVTYVFKANQIIFRKNVMYLAPKGPNDHNCTSLGPHLFSHLNDSLRRRAEVYFTTFAIKKSVKLGVYKLKSPW